MLYELHTVTLVRFEINKTNLQMCLYWDSTIHITFVMNLLIPFHITVSPCSAAAGLRSNCSCDSYVLVSCVDGVQSGEQ